MGAADSIVRAEIMSDRIQIIDATRGRTAELDNLCARSLADLGPDVEEQTREIVNRVREYGDQALVEYTRRFDCDSFTAADIIVEPDEIQAAYDEVPAEWIGAVRRARENVFEYHERTMSRSWLDDFDGVYLGQRVTPVASAGICVPAASASLPSTVWMTVMPARAAGVPNVVMVSPPRSDGSIDPIIAVAAGECGVDEFYRIGGAHAVAALAYGTETVQSVDLIVGPGNPYVVMAKKMVFGHVNIEALPGPSESVIIADGSSSVELTAVDLLSQAEHTGDNTVILITDDEDFAYQVRDETYAQLAQLPRAELTTQSLREYGAIVIVADIAAAVQLSNTIAPEHLQLLVPDPLAVLDQIENAGCIFMGPRSPVALGDYAAGPSHVLPTNGTARFSSALSTDHFVKKSSLIYATRLGLERLGPDVSRLAESEGLTAHARSVQMRLQADARRSCADQESGE